MAKKIKEQEVGANCELKNYQELTDLFVEVDVLHHALEGVVVVEKLGLRRFSLLVVCAGFFHIRS